MRGIISPEVQYLEALEDLIHRGDYREGRNGGVYSMFGRQMRFDLSQGFPLLTTKKVHLKSIVAELLRFLTGSTNAKPLQDQGVRIWDEWASPEGDLGPIYGHQWRTWSHVAMYDHWVPKEVMDKGFRKMDFHGIAGSYFYVWEKIDQIAEVVKSLKEDPYSRRHIVSAWNPADLPKMALPPCHCLFQFFVSTEGKLSCQLYQRSADMFLGVPFNIASYALLTMMMAQATGYEPGEFIHTLGDYHLYANHVDQAKLQISRDPKPFPVMRLNPAVTDIFDFKASDFDLFEYAPHPRIPATVAA